MSDRESIFALAYAWSAFTGRNAVTSGIEALKARRPILIANRSAVKGPAFAELLRAVKKVCGAAHEPPVFHDILPHTPLPVVLNAAAALREHNCDAVISVGAGSAIDAAKGAVLAVGAQAGNAREWNERIGSEGFVDFGARWTGPVLPHLTIPTTLSSAANSHAAGITIDLEKHLHIDARLGPRIVVFNGAFANETPTDLWVSTGIKALEHTVESLYARGLSAMIKPWRLDAFATIMHHLEESATGPQAGRGTAREALLEAAAMSVIGWPSAPLGLSHALGHQAGAQWGMSHGQTSPIFLPAVMAFNAPVAQSAFELMADSFTVASPRGSTPSAKVIEAVETLIGTLGLPQRLRDVGVTPANLDAFAPKVLRDPIMSGNPRAVTERDVAEIVAKVA